MNEPSLKAVLEGLLFLIGEEGLSAEQMANIVSRPETEVRTIIQTMQRDFLDNGRGIQIVQVAGHFKLCTLPEHAPYFQKLAYVPRRSSLSQASLETLAIIAYRQPVTRIEVEQIRGVASERVIATLMNKKFIQEVGRSDAPGRPIFYGTTSSFLEHFGLNTLEDLPPQSEWVDSENSPVTVDSVESSSKK